MKRALIFGVSGQSGSYLAQFLLARDYEVIGTWNTHRPDISNVELVRLEMGVMGYVTELVKITRPDEIYNLAAMMFAPKSWEYPYEYMAVNGLAVVELLAAVEKYSPKTRVFQAGSAEVFDRKFDIQNEDTPRQASSPYALSKIVAEEAVKMYRHKGGWACTGILFNMESPRRPQSFFAERIAKEVVRARKEFDTGKRPKLEFGELSAMRDWGLTEEYVEAMWLMLQAAQPRDYVIGTGQSRSCMNYLLTALKAVGLNASNVDLDVLYTPGTTDKMQADPRKINIELGWKAKSGFHEVVNKLVAAEMTNSSSGVVGS